MMRLNLTRLAVAFLLASLSVPAYSQAVDDLPEAVRANIRERIEAGDHPGIVVGVVDRDGRRAYGFGTIGEANSAEPGGDTVYEIGSVTKVFTSLLLAEMVERGEVGVEDPVAEYLDEGVTMTRGGDIKLSYLASHTSGLPRLPLNMIPRDPSNPYADYSTAQLHEFISVYALQREPGAQYEYSNLGAGLLGHVLAGQAGMSFEDLLAERILVPLDLDDTVISLSDDQRARLALGHSGGREVPGWDIPTLAGAGALRSTADDMLEFLAANLGFVQTDLRPAMIRTFEARAEAGQMWEQDLSVGLGWHILDADGDPIFWHNGGTGGYRSFIGFDPAAERGVVVLTNSDQSADDIGFHLLDEDIPLKDARPSVDVDPEILARYVGVYELAPTFKITITTEDGQLFGQATGQPQFALYPSSETRFFIKIVEAEITFHVTDSGEVQSLTLFQNGQQIPGRKVE